MESITINKQKKHYEIKSIMPKSVNVLEIMFAEEPPREYGDIDVYTTGGTQCSHLPGYSTVYRDDGQTMYLSNDGSVWKGE